eukprot:gene34138-44109_t
MKRKSSDASSTSLSGKKIAISPINRSEKILARSVLNPDKDGELVESSSLPANQRPENCLRYCRTFSISSSSFFHEEFEIDSRILILGDGDFSFSLCAAEYSHCHQMPCQILATSYESMDSVLSIYPTGCGNLQRLNDLNVTVKHSIDAANLAESFLSSNLKNPELLFDLVIWNFPCVAARNGADGQATELEENKILLRKFFQNIHSYLVHDPLQGRIGAVHITHKTIEPFSWWDIEDIAEENGFRFRGAVVFDRCNFPGYINRKALDKKSFPSNDALIYVFTSTRNGPAAAVVEEEEEEEITPYNSYNSCWNLSQNKKLVSLQSRKTMKHLFAAAETIVECDKKKKKKTSG